MEGAEYLTENSASKQGRISPTPPRLTPPQQNVIQLNMWEVFIAFGNTKNLEIYGH